MYSHSGFVNSSPTPPHPFFLFSFVFFRIPSQYPLHRLQYWFVQFFPEFSIHGKYLEECKWSRTHQIFLLLLLLSQVPWDRNHLQKKKKKKKVLINLLLLFTPCHCKLVMYSLGCSRGLTFSVPDPNVEYLHTPGICKNGDGPGAQSLLSRSETPPKWSLLPVFVPKTQTHPIGVLHYSRLSAKKVSRVYICK